MPGKAAGERGSRKNRILLAGQKQPSTPGALQQKEQKFDHSVDRHAKPQVHKQAQVSMVWMMLGRWRKKGREQKIDGIAKHDGNQILDPAFCS
jgi:hypothetical protein